MIREHPFHKQMDDLSGISSSRFIMSDISSLIHCIYYVVTF